MGLLDTALSPLRSVLGAAEHEVEHVIPVRDLEDIQSRVLEGVEAVRNATESIERHVEVLEGLATSLPPLTVAVQQLTVELNGLLQVLAPMAAIEHDVEQAEHLFGRFRHHQHGGDAPVTPPDAG